MKQSFGLGRPGKLLFLIAAILQLGSASPTPTPKPPPPATRANPEELLRQGALALEAGQAELVIEYYKAALKATAPDPAKQGLIEFFLGTAYERAQRWQESIDAFNSAVRDNSRLGHLPYVGIGLSYENLGQWHEALEAFLKADRIKSDEPLVEAGIGASLDALGRSGEAIPHLEKAVHLQPALSGGHFLVAMAYSHTGSLDHAIREFRKAIELQPDYADAYIYLGETFGKSKRYDDEVAAELTAIGINPKIPIAYYLLGSAYGSTNRLALAASAYARAVELKPDYFDAYARLALSDIQLQRLTDGWKALQAIERLNGTSTNYAVYLSLAISYQTFGLWQGTVNSATQAIGLNPGCVECYWFLGMGYQYLGLAEESRKAYQQALAIKPNYSPALYGLGQLAETAGNFASAQNYLDAASRMLNETSNATVRAHIDASILTERGDIQRDIGNYADAFRFYTKAVEAYRSLGDHREAGSTLAKVAEVYRQLGDFRASAQWYNYALAESQQARDDDAELTDVVRLDYLAGHVGDLSAQVKYRQQAVRLASNVLKDPSKATADSILTIAEIEAEYGKPEDAITHLQMLVATYNKLPKNVPAHRRKLAFALAWLGEAHMRAHHYEAALSAFKEAEAIAEKYQSPEVISMYARIGDAYEKLGNLDAALQYDRRAAELMEDFATAQELPELQLFSQELTWGVYENLTRITFELYSKSPSEDLLAQIFKYHEQGRTRVLLDLLSNAGVRPREGVDPKLVQQEDGLRKKIAALQYAFSDERVSELKKISLEQALAAQTRELQRIHHRIAEGNPKYQIFASPTGLIVADVSRLLDDSTVLLDYDLGPELSGVGVVTNREARVFRLPAQDLIHETLQQFLPTLREPLIQRSEIDRHVQLAKLVYADLIGPVRDQIRGKHHIVIVPDADLFYLPFEAIIDAEAKPGGPSGSLASQAYLGKIYDFSYAPSASVLVTLQRLNKNRSFAQRALLAFGDPAMESTPASSQIALSTRGAYEQMGVGFGRLPYSAEEVRLIMAAYGVSSGSGSVYLGSNATKKAFIGLDLSQYRIIHLATHAVMSDEVKWITQPALIFSPDGSGAPDNDVLKMSDIFNLRLNADLVVLSACETAQGSFSRGEGIVGLTSAFLFAGTRSVVASLWKVNDESTSIFMESFYKSLRSGLSAAEALRAARIQTMSKEIKSGVTGEQLSLASPFFWAPFVLVGEWN